MKPINLLVFTTITGMFLAAIFAVQPTAIEASKKCFTFSNSPKG